MHDPGPAPSRGATPLACAKIRSSETSRSPPARSVRTASPMRAARESGDHRGRGRRRTRAERDPVQRRRTPGFHRVGGDRLRVGFERHFNLVERRRLMKASRSDVISRVRSGAGGEMGCRRRGRGSRGGSPRGTAPGFSRAQLGQHRLYHTADRAHASARDREVAEDQRRTQKGCGRRGGGPRGNIARERTDLGPPRPSARVNQPESSRTLTHPG